LAFVSFGSGRCTIGRRNYTRIFEVLFAEGITIETALSSATIPWSEFVKVLANGDTLLLYRAPNMFQILSERFFQSADDWQKARELSIELIKR
jgi:hypothetical protein